MNKRLQSKENEGRGKMVKVLIELPDSVHEKAQYHQSQLTGRKGGKVTIASACADLIEKATKHIKIKTSEQ
jgi:hypothetical protein